MSLRRKFTQTKFFRAMIIFALSAVFVAVGPEGLLGPVRMTVMTATLPLQKIFSLTAFESRDTFRFFASISDLKSENERLEKERLRLFAENSTYADVRKENEELRRELGLLPRDRFSLRAAEVIGRDISGLGNWLSIDQGSLQGLRKGMPVIIEAGVLVGRVEEVFPANARVMLLSNPESLVSGIASETDAKGLAKGEYGLGMLFDMVQQSDALKTGDAVVTSGLGGDMPAGLLIGTLQETRFSADRLFQQASIVPPVPYDRLRYVFIIENTL